MENGIVYIYGLVDPRKDEIFYIGYTKNLRSRYNAHLNVNGYRKKMNPHKNGVIRKILNEGLKPEMRILNSCEKKHNKTENKYEHELLEIKYIKEYREKGINLTNLTDGGDGGSTKTKKAYQYSEDGVFLKEYSSYIEIGSFYNINPTIFTKIVDQNGKKSYRGTYFFSSKKKANVFKFKKVKKDNIPIVQYSLMGKFIKEFKNQREASRILNIHQPNINKCLKGERKQSGGYYWFYKNKIPKIMSKYSNTSKPVMQYDLKSKLVSEFKSITEVSRILNISRSYLTYIIKRNKIYKSFIFKYKNNK